MGGAIISESGGGIIPLGTGAIIQELGGGFLRNQHTANRFQARYSGQTSARICSTEGCSNTTKQMNGTCGTCSGHLRRFGHPLQTLPTTAEMDKFIRRMEEARGRLKNLDLAALEARWTTLVDDARAKATPSYKDKGTLSYTGWEREAAQLIRDVSDVIPFTRALDLLGAIHLMQIERHTFKSDEAFQCSTVELLRRTSRVSCKVVAMNNTNGTISRSYRREMGKDSRLACAKLLMVSLGSAAQALAKRESKRADEAKAVQSDYWAAVHAIEQAA
jgi:hypothetical protein